MLPPFSVVIPAFNEQENVAQLFADLERRPELAARASSIVIVDDGSSDLTPLLVSAYDGPLPIELLRFDQNQGPGAAFRAGFEASQGGFEILGLRAALRRHGDQAGRKVGHPHTRHSFVAILAARAASLDVHNLQIGG